MIVHTRGFEPPRDKIPLGPQPSASTNFATCARENCDLAGARTQDPLLKREMLYQLSYQVFLKECKYIFNLIIFKCIISLIFSFTFDKNYE